MNPLGGNLMSWTFKEAQELISALQPIARKFNFHVCLGGDVLNRGRSKTLDVYFLDMDNGYQKDSNAMFKWLVDHFGEGQGPEFAPLNPNILPSRYNLLSTILRSPFTYKTVFTLGKRKIGAFIM